MDKLIKNNIVLAVLSGLFFLSGSSGLMYQVSWQRVLNIAFGSNYESATIIVAAFMLGLGFGAIIGGLLSDKYSNKTLLLFCGCEIGIGLYGLMSYTLILAVGDLFIQYNLFVIALVNFILVLIPALLMGATLPILITYVVRQWNNIGHSTGHLYAVNTFGATLGAFLTGFVLFHYFTLDIVIVLAALINFVVAIGTFMLFRGEA